MQLPNIIERNDLPYLFNAMGLRQSGMEIGVWEGNFSFLLRERWQGDTLYLVDRWQYVEGYQDMCNIAQSEQDKLFQRVSTMFSNDSSVHIIRSNSLEIAANFPNGSLDWIYLDAEHTYEALRADLLAWYPKIRHGGILAGHDYLDGINENNTLFGVKSAVDEFALRLQVAPSYTGEENYKSWYLQKVCELV